MKSETYNNGANQIHKLVGDIQPNEIIAIVCGTIHSTNVPFWQISDAFRDRQEATSGKFRQSIMRLRDNAQFLFRSVMANPREITSRPRVSRIIMLDECWYMRAPSINRREWEEASEHLAKVRQASPRQA